MNDQFNEQDRERTLAELRKERIGHQLVVAHLDWLGLMLRDGMIQPWGVRAAIADLHGKAEGAADDRS